MVPWRNQQMSPTNFLMNSKHPWKLLVAMHHGSMKIMRDTTEVFTTWLEQYFLTVIKIQINGSLKHIHNQNSIYAKSTVN